MRDFLRELFALPKYKIWNLFLLIMLVLLGDCLSSNYSSYVFTKDISRDFYNIHTYIYVGMTVLCMIILMCNKFRGKKCWYFLAILNFDLLLLGAPADVTGNISSHVYMFGQMSGIVMYIVIIIGLIDLRHIRLNLKPSRWDIAMRIILFSYILHCIHFLAAFTAFQNN